MHEHTWLDYQDGGVLKCPCGVNQEQFTAEGGVLPSQDNTEVSASDTTNVNEVTEVAPTEEAPVTEGVALSSEDQGETVTASTETPFREEATEPTFNEPAADTASVEGTDFAFTQPGDTPVSEPAQPAEPASDVVNETPADTNSLNEVALSIIDEAVAKLEELKKML